MATKTKTRRYAGKPGNLLDATPELNPIAEVLPAMGAKPFADLVADIRANGLIEPIMLDADGRVIDGRHRLRACLEADVRPRYTSLPPGADIPLVVKSLNLDRRHLTPKELNAAASRLRQFALDAGQKMTFKKAAEMTGGSARGAKRASQAEQYEVRVHTPAGDSGAPEVFRFSTIQRAGAVRKALAVGALDAGTLRARKQFLDQMNEDAFSKALEFCIARYAAGSVAPQLDLVLDAIMSVATAWHVEMADTPHDGMAGAMQYAALSEAGKKRWVGLLDEDEAVDAPAQTDGEAADETALADDEADEAGEAAAADGEGEETGGHDILSVDPQRVDCISNDEQGLSWQERLLDALMEMDPGAFERLCQRMLWESGFIEVEVTGRSGDGGIDGYGIIRMGGLISFPVLFQCKRYQGNVAASVVRDFRGAMQGRSDKGLLITTGGFTRDAKAEATRDGAPPIDLIDGALLAEKLKELGLGVKTEMVEQVTVDAAFFEGI